MNEAPQAVVIGCGSVKAARLCMAKDLYRGGLFRCSRRWAEQRGLPWFIISAKHGLLLPTQPVAPYDWRLAQNDAEAFIELLWRQAKGLRCVVSLAPLEYTEAMRAAGLDCLYPLLGKRFGQRMRWMNTTPHE